MGKAAEFFLPRTYERIDARGVPVSEPLEASRSLSAYVLLGEPGSGKTDAFEREARACGGWRATSWWQRQTGGRFWLAVG